MKNLSTIGQKSAPEVLTLWHAKPYARGQCIATLLLKSSNIPESIACFNWDLVSSGNEKRDFIFNIQLTDPEFKQLTKLLIGGGYYPNPRKDLTSGNSFSHTLRNSDKDLFETFDSLSEVIQYEEVPESPLDLVKVTSIMNMLHFDNTSEYMEFLVPFVRADQSDQIGRDLTPEEEIGIRDLLVSLNQDLTDKLDTYINS
jgi:hypothetical protein